MKKTITPAANRHHVVGWQDAEWASYERNPADVVMLSPEGTRWI